MCLLGGPGMHVLPPGDTPAHPQAPWFKSAWGGGGVGVGGGMGGGSNEE